MAEKKTRAKNDKGQFIADDPSTPDVNEAYVQEEKKDEGYAKTKKFKGQVLKFTAQGKYPDGRKVPFKNMKTMKALQVDPDGMVTGNVVQLPWEQTVNNGVAGNPEDQIGLKKYERKGFIFCVDDDGTPLFSTELFSIKLSPLFSTLWDDWSEYDAEYEHKLRQKNLGESGKFASNATTSRTMGG